MNKEHIAHMEHHLIQERKDMQTLSELEEKFDKRISKMKTDFEEKLESSLIAFFQRLNETIDMKIQKATDENKRYLDYQVLQALKESEPTRAHSTKKETQTEVSTIEPELAHRLSHIEDTQQQLQRSVQMLSLHTSQYMERKDIGESESKWYNSGTQSYGTKTYSRELQLPGANPDAHGDDVSLPFGIYRRKLEDDLVNTGYLDPSGNHFSFVAPSYGSTKFSPRRDPNQGTSIGIDETKRHTNRSIPLPTSETHGVQHKILPPSGAAVRTEISRTNASDFNSSIFLDLDDLTNPRNQSHQSEALQLSELDNPQPIPITNLQGNHIHRQGAHDTSLAVREYNTQTHSDNRVRFSDHYSESTFVTSAFDKRPSSPPTKDTVSNSARMSETISQSQHGNSLPGKPEANHTQILRGFPTKSSAIHDFDFGVGVKLAKSHDIHKTDRKGEYIARVFPSSESHRGAPEFDQLDERHQGYLHPRVTLTTSPRHSVLANAHAASGLADNSGDDLDITLEPDNHSVVYDFITRLAN